MPTGGNRSRMSASAYSREFNRSFGGARRFSRWKPPLLRRETPRWDDVIAGSVCPMMPGDASPGRDPHQGSCPLDDLANAKARLEVEPRADRSRTNPFVDP